MDLIKRYEEPQSYYNAYAVKAGEIQTHFDGVDRSIERGIKGSLIDMVSRLKVGQKILLAIPCAVESRTLSFNITRNVRCTVRAKYAHCCHVSYKAKNGTTVNISPSWSGLYLMHRKAVDENG